MERPGSRLWPRVGAASLALFLAIALAAAGCGGSGKAQPQGSSPTNELTAPSSKSARARSSLIPTADAICKKLNAKLASERTDPHNDGELARGTRRHLALERAALLELAKLKPPSSLAQNWKQVVGYRRALAEELATLVGYAEAHNDKGIAALKASKLRLHRRLYEIASRAGFKDCALVGPGRVNGPSSPTPHPSGTPTTRA
jgi:hypothetical protein